MHIGYLVTGSPSYGILDYGSTEHSHVNRKLLAHAIFPNPSLPPCLNFQCVEVATILSKLTKLKALLLVGISHPVPSRSLTPSPSMLCPPLAPPFPLLALMCPSTPMLQRAPTFRNGWHFRPLFISDICVKFL